MIWTGDNGSALGPLDPARPSGQTTEPVAAARAMAPDVAHTVIQRRRSIEMALQEMADPEAPDAVEVAYEQCRQIAREVARTFYYGSLFLAPEKRRAAWALYAFCRIADDIADDPAPGADASTQLRRWHEALLDTYAGHPHGPVMRAWADVLTRFEVPLQPALDLLDGVEMDVRNARYATFDDLRIYCYRVAGTVGLLMLPVLGYSREEALGSAVDLGIAMQLTNILRDIGEDVAQGRIYLPAEEMAAFGYSEEELRAGQITPAFLGLLEYQMARAEDYYQRGLSGVALLSPDAQLAIALSGALYRAILGRIRRNGYDVYSRRAHLSLPGKLAALPGIWLRLQLGAYTRKSSAFK